MIALEEKRFGTLAVQYALDGHTLVRPGIHQRDALTGLHWGWITPVANLDGAARLLRKIGGAK